MFIAIFKTIVGIFFNFSTKSSVLLFVLFLILITSSLIILLTSSIFSSPLNLNFATDSFTSSSSFGFTTTDISISFLLYISLEIMKRLSFGFSFITLASAVNIISI